MTSEDFCMDRRRFLLLAGSTTVSLGALGLTSPAGADPKTVAVRLRDYPRREVARWTELRVGEPKTYRYPFDEPYCSSLIVRLGREAWAGVGPRKDLVSFNQICTHQGGFLDGRFQPGHGVLGPCPVHLTTFDLARGGMVVSGHATQGLPQVLLTLENDVVFAHGLIGLVYGCSDNRLYPADGGDHE